MCSRGEYKTPYEVAMSRHYTILAVGVIGLE